MARNVNRRPGFTLIEVLVVIAVLAVLSALLVPAVQKVREASRGTQCMNNVKQLASGCLAHADQHGWLPSAGWGWSWVGSPHRGNGPEQPGGWAYAILPYLEQSELRKLGFGKTGIAFIEDMRTLVTKPVPTFNCPSRRSAKTFVAVEKFRAADSARVSPVFQPSAVVRGDYAGNAGSTCDASERGPGPASTAEGDSIVWWQSTFPYNGLPRPNGVVFQRSKVTRDDITRGVSNVYLVGERYLSSDNYENGLDPADKGTIYGGFSNDICRVTYTPPVRDRAKVLFPVSFGSTHAGGLNMAYCDGSVRVISYNVNYSVHSVSGVRFQQNP